MSVAVVGAGIVGLATTSALLERGVEVVCLDRAGPLRERSAGESRIFRFAHREAELVESARRSRELFGDWERLAGETLIEPVGAVVSGDDVQEWAQAMSAAGAHHVSAPAGDAALHLPTRRHPGESLIDPAGGVIRVDRIGRLLTDRCRPALRTEHVLSLEDVDGGVVVHTSASSDRYDGVVLAAGAGNAQLAATVGLYPPVALAHHTRFTFRLREGAGTGFQAWITSSRNGTHSYQHAGTPGHWAVGIELEARDTRWEVGREAATALAEAATVAYVRNELELVDPQVVGQLYCTTNPGLDDGIHYLRRGNTIAVYGENLFKFAPLIGREVAEAVIAGTAPRSVGPAH